MIQNNHPLYNRIINWALVNLMCVIVIYLKVNPFPHELITDFAKLERAEVGKKKDQLLLKIKLKGN